MRTQEQLYSILFGPNILTRIGAYNRPRQYNIQGGLLADCSPVLVRKVQKFHQTSYQEDMFPPETNKIRQVQILETSLAEKQNDIIDIDSATRPAVKIRSLLGNKVGVFSKINAAMDSLSYLLIIIPNPVEVRDYLLEHPDLINILTSMCHAARQHFNENTEISLELFRDKENESDKYLTLYFRQSEYDKKIISRIDEVYSQFEQILLDKQGWILMTTDFRRPISSRHGF